MRSLPALLALLLILPMAAQQSEPAASWLFPSDASLDAAMRAGYSGAKPSWPTLCSTTQSPRCGGDVFIASIRTPLDRALLVGSDARAKFADAPSLTSLRELKGRPEVVVAVCSYDPEDRFAVAIESAGEIYRAAKTSFQSSPASMFCPGGKRWLVGATAEFGPPKTVPTSGHGDLVVRWTARPDVRVPLSFDALR